MRRDLVEAGLAARYARVSPATLRSWVRRPETGIKRYGGKYSVTEIEAWTERRNANMIRGDACRDTPSERVG